MQQPIKHMVGAGRDANNEQRCIFCGAVLSEYRDASTPKDEPHEWPAGVVVVGAYVGFATSGDHPAAAWCTQVVEPRPVVRGLRPVYIDETGHVRELDEMEVMR